MIFSKGRLDSLSKGRCGGAAVAAARFPVQCPPPPPLPSTTRGTFFSVGVRACDTEGLVRVHKEKQQKEQKE
jgi:hypothetical protein